MLEWRLRRGLIPEPAWPRTKGGRHRLRPGARPVKFLRTPLDLADRHASAWGETTCSSKLSIRVRALRSVSARISGSDPAALRSPLRGPRPSPSRVRSPCLARIFHKGARRRLSLLAAEGRVGSAAGARPIIVFVNRRKLSIASGSGRGLWLLRPCLPAHGQWPAARPGAWRITICSDSAPAAASRSTPSATVDPMSFRGGLQTGGSRPSDENQGFVMPRCSIINYY